MSKHASRRMLVLFPFLVGFACPAAAAEARVSEDGRLPLHFEANRGQTHEDVRFLARGPGYSLFLTPTEAVLTLVTPESPARRPVAHGKPEPRGPATATVMRMTFAGANPDLRVMGLEELPGKANYFIDNNPAKWRTNIPTYAKVQYREVYPGIDLVYYGNQRQLEYDFVVRPGADPSAIALRFMGADKLEVDVQGDLVLHTVVGPIRQRKPVIYQEIDGVRKEIPGGYVLKDEHHVGFKVAAYDASRRLVIDPVLFYSTYLGGNNSDLGYGIAVDGSGNAYVTGVALSSNFPTTAGGLQTTFGGVGDAFVTKLNPTGSGLVYSTYFGGDNLDFGRGIAVDALGNAYVTGVTESSNFPTTTGAFQTTAGGGVDAFVTKLNPTGSGLVYSTYVGNDTDSEYGYGIAVDGLGNAFVAGFTTSANFPTTLGAFQITAGGGDDAFVIKLNPTGSGLVYSTYLGGNSADQGYGIAVDGLGNAYVVGATQSSNFPTTPGPFQTANGGGYHPFVTKLNPTGSSLVYSIYLGGNSYDSGGFGIAVDVLGNAYVAGITASSNFPTTAGAFQTTFGGYYDAFVTKLNPTGSGLVYSSYLGGGGDDQGNGIAVDSLPSPNAYVTGAANSSNLPTTVGAFPTAFAGGAFDSFVAKITDVVPPPPPDEQCPPSGEGNCEQGKGGGDVNEGNGDKHHNGNFSFIVQRKIATQRIYGDLQYVNPRRGTKLQSVDITSLVISGKTATFTGTCTNNGKPCFFTVYATDSGPRGAHDIFTLSISGGRPKGGTVRSGKIQIRP